MVTNVSAVAPQSVSPPQGAATSCGGTSVMKRSTGDVRARDELLSSAVRALFVCSCLPARLAMPSWQQNGGGKNWERGQSQQALSRQRHRSALSAVLHSRGGQGDRVSHVNASTSRGIVGCVCSVFSTRQASALPRLRSFENIVVHLGKPPHSNKQRSPLTVGLLAASEAPGPPNFFGSHRRGSATSRVRS